MYKGSTMKQAWPQKPEVPSSVSSTEVFSFLQNLLCSISFLEGQLVVVVFRLLPTQHQLLKGKQMLSSCLGNGACRQHSPVQFLYFCVLTIISKNNAKIAKTMLLLFFKYCSISKVKVLNWATFSCFYLILIGFSELGISFSKLDQRK